MLIVSSVTKSASWSADKPLAVVRFVCGESSQSKFAVGSLSDNESYSLTYDLGIIYAKECKDDDDKFDAAAAFKLFKAEMPVGHEEPVNGYEFSISELTNGSISAVKVKSSGRVMRTMRPACYGSREKARLLALNNLKTRLARKDFIPENEDNNNDDDEE
jgi:hypothetical protein